MSQHYDVLINDSRLGGECAAMNFSKDGDANLLNYSIETTSEHAMTADIHRAAALNGIDRLL